MYHNFIVEICVKGSIQRSKRITIVSIQNQTDLIVRMLPRHNPFNVYTTN